MCEITIRYPINIRRIKMHIEHSNVQNVYVVGGSLSQCKLIITQLKEWLSDLKIEYTGVTRPYHLDGKDYKNSLFILCGDWYYNRQIREEIFKFIDLKGVFALPVDDIYNYGTKYVIGAEE